MQLKDLNKWYNPIVLFVGTIISFADPITDIITLVEFYRADHKTWFGVGLTFVILPCLTFPILFYLFRHEELSDDSDNRYAQIIICGFHPFSAAFARLQGFVFCLKKWRCGDKIDVDDNEKADNVLEHINIAVLFESVIESAPQFIIQLYAVSVQEEPVEIIQIISLPVSFLSLAWAFTTFDVNTLIHNLKVDDLNIKHKLVLFVTYLFLLSSRLFAVCYFTVSYKWWVIGVLLFHTFAIVTADIISLWRKGKWGLSAGVESVFFCCVHWLRDNLSLHENDKTAFRRMQVLSNVLLVAENFVMILFFYLSQDSNTWYSLPVTVCVCEFSVLGRVMRLIIYHRVILKE